MSLRFGDLFFRLRNGLVAVYILAQLTRQALPLQEQSHATFDHGTPARSLASAEPFDLVQVVRQSLS